MPGRTSEAIQSSVVADYLAGVDTREIVQKYHISAASISRWVTSRGHPLRRNVAFDEAVAIAMYNSGSTLDNLAIHFDCSAATAYKRLSGKVVFHDTAQRGPNHWNWKGGNSQKYWGKRDDFWYAKWKHIVHARDKGICQLCGRKPKEPQAHHIRCKAEEPDGVYDVNNGITLCEFCHIRLMGRREKAFSGLLEMALDAGRPLGQEFYRWFCDVILNVPPHPCECGCGKFTNLAYGKPVRYVQGHNWRGKKRAPRPPRIISEEELQRRSESQKLPSELFDRVLRLSGSEIPQRSIAGELGVSQGWVSNVILGKTYRKAA